MQKHFAEVLMTACSLGLQLSGEAGDLCMALVQIIEITQSTDQQFPVIIFILETILFRTFGKIRC